MEVGTPLGPARVLRRDPSGAVRGTLVLGHGAGGGIDSPDLTAVTDAAAGAGWRVLGVEQPWKVAGGRVAAAPPRLDVAWAAVLDRLRDDGLLAGPLVLGGRSAGARVACRSAAQQGAAGVLALAFPLHPPGRPEKSRADELSLVAVPLLVVQGTTDAFGGPDEVAAAAPHAVVRGVPGDHALKKDLAAVVAAVLPWLEGLCRDRARALDRDKAP
ncbi:alpha/beta family hydrolase [Geodermatophilus sp. SYSU D00691]